MSEEMFKEFETKTKAEWLAQAEKDLKGRGLSELNFKVSDSLEQSPFHHAEDAQQVYAPLSRKAVCKAQLCFEVKGGDFKPLNALIIKYLENGVNSICLNVHQELSDTEWEIVFKNIHFDFIEVWVNVEYLTSQQASNQTTILSKYSTVKVISADFHKGNYNSSTVFVNNLEQTAKSLMEVLNNSANHILLQVIPDKAYFTNIAYLRALRHIIANVEESGKTFSISLKLTPEKNIENELVETTPTVLAAIIGGADSICLGYNLSAISTEQEQEANRLFSNLYNLALLESNIEFVEDPAAGSYYLEKATQDIATAIWEKMQES